MVELRTAQAGAKQSWATCTVFIITIILHYNCNAHTSYVNHKFIGQIEVRRETFWQSRLAWTMSNKSQWMMVYKSSARLRFRISLDKPLRVNFWHHRTVISTCGSMYSPWSCAASMKKQITVTNNLKDTPVPKVEKKKADFLLSHDDIRSLMSQLGYFRFLK